jgi:hypothetical protein
MWFLHGKQFYMPDSGLLALWISNGTHYRAFVCVFLPTQSKTRWAQGWCRPRSKQQVGSEKEDQDLVSALAASKNASCCRCAKRRPGTLDRDRPLPSSQPLARSLCGHTTRSRLADGEAGRTPYSRFYGDRICGTSRSDRLMRCFPVSVRINHVANDDEAAHPWNSPPLRIGSSRSGAVRLRDLLRRD